MEISWVALTLVSAFSLAVSDAFMKGALRKDNEVSAAWVRLLFCVLPLSVLLFVTERPPIGGGFYIAVAFGLPLELLAMVLYVKALRVSPMSLTLPFLSLTPVLLIVSSYLILGERVSHRGILGIALIAIGSYVLNFHHAGRGILGPLRAVLRERGSVLMIIVATIYSITSVLGKMAILNSSPVFMGSTYFIALTVLYTPLALWNVRGGRGFGIKGRELWAIGAAGIFFAIMIVTHTFAVSVSKVAYMIAVKRTSFLMGAALGFIFFKEKDLRERAFGSAIMFAGVLVLAGAK